MMTILLLLITYHNPDMMLPPQSTPIIRVVDSPEEAAIILWQYNKNPGMFASYTGKLYRLHVLHSDSIDSLGVNEDDKTDLIEIPKVKFVYGGEK